MRVVTYEVVVEKSCHGFELAEAFRYEYQTSLPGIRGQMCDHHE